MSYWQVGGKANDCGHACAPVPFHYKEFWSKGPVSSHKLRDVAGEYADGWHGWETYAFELNGRNEYLQVELTSRRKSMPAVLKQHLRQDHPATFKRTENNAWSEEREEWWGGEYPKYPQGRLSQGKVRMGMRNYMLQRSSKYGNTCRDCQAVLELAPGLYERNTRMVFDKGIVMGNAKVAEGRSSTWWTNLIGRTMAKAKERGREEDEVVELMNFDPGHMHARPDKLSTMQKKDRGAAAEWMRRFEESMEVYTKYLQEHHNVAMGSLTKYKSPPDVYVQMNVPGQSDSQNTPDREHIDRAISDLRAALERPPGPVQVDTSNPALRHMLKEIDAKYVHLGRLERDRKVGRFDADAFRKEGRNERREKDGVEYHNCLVVTNYDKIVYDAQAATQSATAPHFSAVAGDEKVYYATRGNALGDKCAEPKSQPTMWCGDGYVTGYDERLGRWTVGRAPQRARNATTQWRKMRQSRLFITYSLHRPVTSEIEARGVLEKMADASRELFGNDRNLSELLVFGYKLGGFSARGEPTDSVSKARFEVITKTKKKEAMATFYGDEDGSSYIYDTYETHVEYVEMDGGMEIGPQRHHPHFHVLLTITHWSYVQIDYFKMNAYLEMMFRGLDPLQRGWGETFKLVDASGRPFYTDNENPYVDIKLYPQDGWQDVIAAYVRKGSTPSMMEVLSKRAGVN